MLDAKKDKLRKVRIYDYADTQYRGVIEGYYGVPYSKEATEELFRFGADALCGFCVTDEERCRQAVSRKQSVFACGRMVCLEK